MIINNLHQLLEKRRNLRNNLTEEELILWSKLKSSNLKGFKFRRQHSVGQYILDFYCPNKKLAIELDGSQHCKEDNKEYDKFRDEYLESVGIKVLRFSNFELRANLDSVLKRIGDYLERQPPLTPPC